MSWTGDAERDAFLAVDDLKVEALESPSCAVRVRIAAAWIEFAISPTHGQPRTDLVLWRSGRLVVLANASTVDVAEEDDLPLALVRMPMLTSTVQNAQIIDVRPFPDVWTKRRDNLGEVGPLRVGPA